MKKIFSNPQKVKEILFLVMPIAVIIGPSIAFYDLIVNALLWENFTEFLDSQMICFLPVIGMSLTGFILHYAKVENIPLQGDFHQAYHFPERGITLKQALPKLLATLTTVASGASAGLEGASKWLGAILAYNLQRSINRSSRLKFFHQNPQLALLAGAASAVGSILSAPLTGAIMTLESPKEKNFVYEALAHAIFASALGICLFQFFHPLHVWIPFKVTGPLTGSQLTLAIVIGSFSAVIIFIYRLITDLIQYTLKLWNTPLPVQCFFVGLTLSGIALFARQLFGAPLTLQSGMLLLQTVYQSKLTWALALQAMGLKLLATSVTFGGRGVGGPFIPILSSGAAFGLAIDLMLGASGPGSYTIIAIVSFLTAFYQNLLFPIVFLAEVTGDPTHMPAVILGSLMAYSLTQGLKNFRNTQ